MIQPGVSGGQPVTNCSQEIIFTNRKLPPGTRPAQAVSLTERNPGRSSQADNNKDLCLLSSPVSLTLKYRAREKYCRLETNFNISTFTLPANLGLALLGLVLTILLHIISSLSPENRKFLSKIQPLQLFFFL